MASSYYRSTRTAKLASDAVADQPAGGSVAGLTPDRQIHTPKFVLASAATPGAAGVPAGATPLVANSGNQANVAAVATLLNNADGTTVYIQGFIITGLGATAALTVLATLTGILGGTMNFPFTFVAGATLADNALIVTFNAPIPASAINTNIVVTLPAGGAGNTNAQVMAWGYRV